MGKCSHDSLLYNAYVSNVDIYSVKNWACVVEIMALKLNLERQDLSLPKMKFVHKVKVLLKDAFINKWTHDLYDDTRKNTLGNKLRTF